MLAFKIKLLLGFTVFAFLIDWYVWQAYRTLYNKRNPKIKLIVKFIFWAIPILIVSILIASLFYPALEQKAAFRNYLMGIFFVIYLSKFFVVLFLIVDDIKRVIMHSFIFIKGKLRHLKAAEIEKEELEQSEKEKVSRSEFLSRTGILVGTLPLIVLTRGIVKGAYNYKLHKHELFFPNLPDAFDGLKVVQISDIHCGSFNDKDAVYKGIQLIKDQKPDLILFTGDLVNNRSNEAIEWMDMFSEIKAPMGVFSTLGNHDYGDYVSDWKSPEEKQANLEQLFSIHQDMGWNLLRNEHVLIERKFQRFGLIGVENWGDMGRFQKFGDIDKARKGMPDVPFQLLMSHDPSHFDKIVSQKHPDIDLTLSGHTHGFQFGVEIGGFKWSPSQYIYPHWAGKYKVARQMIYVNRGYGFLGYPGRVGILPEITVFTLTNEQ